MRKVLTYFLLFLLHPATAQPVTGCYWEWMNGNISKEGITKDLEYMKAAGIESAFIFDTWVGVERGPVDYTTTGQQVTAAPESGLGLEVDKLSHKGLEAHFQAFLGPLLDQLREYWARCHYGSIERHSMHVLTDYIRQRVALQQQRVTWDFQKPISEDGKSGGYYLRLPRGQREVKTVLYCHQNMTEEVLFRSKKFCHWMDSLGVAMAFIQQGSQNWDVSVKNDNGQTCQERFEQIMQDFARSTEHPELATCPIIPFGHSAQATFPWNFAAWNPERTLCIISYHGDAPRTNLCGYGRANVEWGRTRNIDGIPGLMIEGEYEWWEARVRPALAFRMMYPDSRISFLCDAGKGHFDLCEQTQDYIARFIAKALAAPRPKGGVFYSRWMEDGTESQDPHDLFWYQDEEMVQLTRARYQESRGKQTQYVSAKINGQLVNYHSASHIKLSTTISDKTFSVEPVFVDSTRMEISDSHATVCPRVVLISGPAIQTGDYTFQYDPDYWGRDPKRLWTGITLCIEADGDNQYKSAVQELNIQFRQ